MVKKRGRNWYAIVKINGRKVWRSAGPSKELARALEAKMRLEAAARKHDLPSPYPERPPTLREWWEKTYRKHVENTQRSARSTKCIWEKVLLPELGDYRLDALTPQVVGQFIERQLERVSPSRVNRYTATLSGALTLAVKHGVIKGHPFAKRIPRFDESRNRRSPTLTTEDEQRLLAACPGWLRWVVRGLLVTGCRIGELAALEWRHVDFDSGTLLVEPQKGKDPRRVPIPESFLAELRERRQAPGAPVFPAARGGRLDPNTVSRAFKRICRRLDLPLRLHDLRHVYASRALAAGVSPLVLREILGHRTLIVTSRYAHATPEALAPIQNLHVPAPNPSPPKVLSMEAHANEAHQD